MSLRTRIALIAAAAVALAVALASVAAFSSAKRELIQSIDDSLADRAELVARFPLLTSFNAQRGPGRTGRFPTDPFARAGGGFDALYFQAIIGDGVFIPRGQDLILPIEAPEQEVITAGQGPSIRTVEVDGLRLRMITVRIGDDALQLARSLDEADRTLRGIALAQWATGIIGIVAAAVLGLIVARSALRPVAELTEAAEHVAQTQELAARIDVDRKDEIGRLATSFNAMLEALEKSKSQQQRLVRDASHELRTPLTAVRTNIELLARAGDLPEDEKADLLEDLTTEIVELSALVDELVQLATDSGADEPMSPGLRLDQIVAEVVGRYRRRTGRTITLDTVEVTVDGRSGQLERAIGNLIDNADKWSAPDAPIAVRLSSGSLTVTDSGPGIPQDERDHVFERFYRTEGAHGVPGSGLGLAIVKQIVEDHGGTVFVEEAPTGGAAVGFNLPNPAVLS